MSAQECTVSSESLVTISRAQTHLSLSIEDPRVPALAETAEDDPATVSLCAQGLEQNIILPKWVYIRDRNGRYLTIRSGPQSSTLTFRSGGPDADCIFEAIQISSVLYKFLGRAGGHIMRYESSPGWYSSDNPSAASFNIIRVQSSIVYLKDSYITPRFLSDELTKGGSPLGHVSASEAARMEIGQAAHRKEITHVRYDIPKATVRELPDVVVLTMSVSNESNIDVIKAVTYTYEKWASGTWTSVAGIELGLRPTFTVGVPFVVNAEWDIFVGVPSLQTWGGEEGVKETVTVSKSITIPGKKKGTLTIVLRKAQVEVPFRYRRRIEWDNGKTEEPDTDLDGVYKNTDTWIVAADLNLEAI